MIRRPPRSTQSRSSAASDVYKRQGFGRADASDVNGLAREIPALTVGVIVVPYLAKIEIEDVPANPLPGVGQDGRRVAYEGPAVEAERGHTRRVLGNGM